MTLQLSATETIAILFFATATYLNAGWLREQVCLYMCPYARFQSVMYDSDTLAVSYDPRRGEPRGSRKRGLAREDTPLGDCINCELCVQVCPTGIDIRQGLQVECIGCALCIDACDSVMAKMHYPPWTHQLYHRTQSQRRTLQFFPARVYWAILPPCS